MVWQVHLLTGRLGLALCLSLWFAAPAGAQSSPTSAAQYRHLVGSFKFSTGEFWALDRDLGGSLALRSDKATGDESESKLTIESVPLDGQSAKVATINHLRRQADMADATSARTVGQRWQLVRGKTVAGHEAWLGQRRTTQANQATQQVSLIIAGESALLSFLLSSKRSTLTKPSRHTAQRALGELLSSVTSVGQAPAPSHRWRPSQKPLSGFYATIGGSKSQASFSAHRHMMGVSGLRLDANGWFAFSERGLDQKIEAYCQTPTQTCGRYAVGEDSVSTWRSTTDFEERVAFMREQHWTFKQEPDQSLLIGGERHLLIEQPDRQALNGRYRSAMRSNARYQETVFEFQADGQFTESGFTASNGLAGSPVSLSDASANKEGTFEVEGFTLLLTYQDGKQKKHSLFLLGSAPVIDGNMFQQLHEPGPAD